MFPNVLNQCQLHNCHRFLLGYLISHCPATSIYVILLHTNSDFLLPVQSDSSGTENTRLLPAIKQL